MNMLEAMKALIEGKKIRHQDWREHSFIWIVNGDVINQKGLKTSYNMSEGFHIYTEPKKLTKIYKYAIRNLAGHWSISTYYYKDESALKNDIFKDTLFKRLDYTMLEVEE